MKARPIYLDSSALVKLVFEEPETAALERFLHAWPLRACSLLGQVEVGRIARRVADPLVERHARRVLARLALINHRGHPHEPCAVGGDRSRCRADEQSRRERSH